MTDFKAIYATQAAQYERLVAREDVDGNILQALAAIRPLPGCDVVELGAGTGRLTCLLAPLVRSVTAFDQSAAMLAVAAHKLRAEGGTNWGLAVADHRAIPLNARVADMAIEGWAFGHFVGWFPHSWRAEAGQALAQMARLLRPGGTMVLLETLGTGRAQPQAPAALRPFYQWLETEHGFQATWLRTDYHFATLDEAAELLGFFFGEEMAAQAVAQAAVRFPECTGVWSKTIDR